MEARDLAPSGLPGRACPTVLVVEDEALLALDLRQMLERLGFDVATLAQVEAARPPPARLAAAVVNLNLGPGMPSGQEVIRHLRARRSALPVVVVTGYAARAPQANLRGLGGPTARVEKPFSPEDLRRAFDDVLAPEAERLARRVVHRPAAEGRPHP